MQAVTCAQQQPPATTRLSKALKQLEARRVARVKTLGARLSRTLKHADLEARELLVQDLRDVATAASDALLPRDEPEPQPEDQMRS